MRTDPQPYEFAWISAYVRARRPDGRRRRPGRVGRCSCEVSFDLESDEQVSRHDRDHARLGHFTRDQARRMLREETAERRADRERERRDAGPTSTQCRAAGRGGWPWMVDVAGVHRRQFADALHDAAANRSPVPARRRAHGERRGREDDEAGDKHQVAEPNRSASFPPVSMNAANIDACPATTLELRQRQAERPLDGRSSATTRRMLWTMIMEGPSDRGEGRHRLRRSPPTVFPCQLCSSFPCRPPRIIRRSPIRIRWLSREGRTGIRAAERCGSNRRMNRGPQSLNRGGSQILLAGRTPADPRFSGRTTDSPAVPAGRPRGARVHR